MNLPTAAELKALIATCWEAAAHAPMAGIADGMEVAHPMVVINGAMPQLLNMTRYDTYKILLTNLVPNRFLNDLKVQTEKEPWQTDEGE